jgi:hypothetical protein
MENIMPVLKSISSTYEQLSQKEVLILFLVPLLFYFSFYELFFHTEVSPKNRVYMTSAMEEKVASKLQVKSYKRPSISNIEKLAHEYISVDTITKKSDMLDLKAHAYFKEILLFLQLLEKEEYKIENLEISQEERTQRLQLHLSLKL